MTTRKKINQKHINCPLVAGFSHEPRPRYVGGWDMGQTKNSKQTSNTFFPKMVSVFILGSFR